MRRPSRRTSSTMFDRNAAATGSTIKTVFAALLTWCCITSLAADDRDATNRLFTVGTRYDYDFSSVVFVDGPSRQANGNPVGHRVVGQLSVTNLWSSPGDKLLRIHLKSPKLQTWSKKWKNDAHRQFINRKSKLDKFTDKPFFVHWKNGHIENLYTPVVESLSESNFKKGIAALFQFQLSEQRTIEYSPLGECNVTYSKFSDNTITKQINECVSSTELPKIKHPDKIWQGILHSKREGSIIYNDETLVQMSFEENHEFFITFMNEVGASVSSKQHIKLKKTKSKGNIIKANTFEEAIRQLKNTEKLELEKQSLNTKHKVKNCKHYKSCNKLEEMVNEYHDSLLDTELGKSKSAFGAVKVMEAIINSDSKTIKKILTEEKNKDILNQLYDLLGAVSNENSHKAAIETLDFTNDENVDQVERYLWSASIKFNPKIEIITSLISYADKNLASKKLQDTVYNTITAMVNRLVRYNHTKSNILLYNKLVVETLDRLGKCDDNDDDCLLTYIRALANLKHPLSISVLLNFAQNGNRKISAYAMKTIKTFGPDLWNDEVFKYCNRIFFQLIKEQDSSTRTIALSILLESNPDYDLLKHVIKWLIVPDEGYEIKQYTLELLKEMANQNKKSAKLLRTVLIQEKLNHYGCMAQRGLSSSFSRQFVSYNDIVGLVKTSQLIYTGVTKRGSVDVVFERDGIQYNLCNFGMFSTGLGYFTSLYDESGKTDTSDESNLPATAGIELSVFGVHIRPFVMFSSRGQLMGQVWSGTGSERTPIIQGIYQMIDHLEYVPLSNGITVELNLKGTLSLDIAGQVEMSLWNKNAQSAIEKNGGVSIQGALNLDADFVMDQVNFSLVTEGLLHVYSDADFATKIVLCMQIIFVDTNVTTSIHKSVKVNEQPYESYINATWTRPVSGRTFALNKLANEFCNIIHSQ